MWAARERERPTGLSRGWGAGETEWKQVPAASGASEQSYRWERRPEALSPSSFPSPGDAAASPSARTRFCGLVSSQMFGAWEQRSVQDGALSARGRGGWADGRVREGSASGGLLPRGWEGRRSARLRRPRAAAAVLRRRPAAAGAPSSSPAPGRHARASPALGLVPPGRFTQASLRAAASWVAPVLPPRGRRLGPPRSGRCGHPHTASWARTASALLRLRRAVDLSCRVLRLLGAHVLRLVLIF